MDGKDWETNQSAAPAFNARWLPHLANGAAHSGRQLVRKKTKMKRRHILATVFIYQMHWVRASKGACKVMIANSLDIEPGCRFADVDKLVDMVFDQPNSAPVDEAAEERVARRSEKKTSGIPKLVHQLRAAIWKIGEAGSARRKADRHDTVGLVFYRDGDRLYFVQGAEFQLNQAKRKPWQRHSVI